MIDVLLIASPEDVSTVSLKLESVATSQSELPCVVEAPEVITMLDDVNAVSITSELPTRAVV